MFGSAESAGCATYVWPEVLSRLPPTGEILDVGCGNGALVAELASRGYQALGIDLSEDGIAVARETHPDLRFELLDAGDLSTLGTFDAVVATEVIEHLFSPLAFVQAAHAALKGTGTIVLSTPYHGWLKNTAVAATGHFDSHVNPLFEGGHIKFFSRATLTRLLEQTGFTNVRFRGSGRLPYLWKSMILAADKA